ncbi:hypothetical protein [Methylocella sp.]|uniref:hypothetical protein n=1 Tax=Methylocella sp. TaxID=1978226 RepID=UPI003783CBFB
MTKTRPAPPEWFTKKDYSYLQSRDARGWFQELERCAHLVEEARRREAGEPSFAQEWGDILGEEIAAGMIPGGILGPPAVQFLDACGVVALHEIERPAALCLINLRAPDAVIMEELALGLAAARAQQAIDDPVKKPGNKKQLPRSNARIGAVEFARWRTHRIVELAELLEWRSRDAPKLPFAVIAHWLFDTRDEKGKLIHTARATLDRALGLLPTLSAQIAELHIAAPPSDDENPPK